MPGLNLKPSHFTAFLGVILLLCGNVAHAEQFIDEQGVRIHYNAMPSNSLTAEVAREYQIKRSKARGIVVITVQSGDPEFTPMLALVTGRLRNLVGQIKGLDFRMVKESQAIYYIAEFRYSHMETMRFELTVQPETISRPRPNIPVKFVQKFYQDDHAY